jgi:hypothetical protein
MTQVGGIAVDARDTHYWVAELASLWPTQYRLALSGEPDPATIQVALNGVALGSGWSYDPTTHAVLIGISALPLVSTDKVTVRYALKCG